MSKVMFVFAAILLATSLGAQDSLTDEQQAEKCQAEGGCAIFTRTEVIELMRVMYKKGLHACNNNV